jgi:hypothetical protein
MKLLIMQFSPTSYHFNTNICIGTEGCMGCAGNPLFKVGLETRGGMRQNTRNVGFSRTFLLENSPPQKGLSINITRDFSFGVLCVLCFAFYEFPPLWALCLLL